MDIWVSIQNDVLLNSTFYFYIQKYVYMNYVYMYIFVFTGEGDTTPTIVNLDRK